MELERSVQDYVIVHALCHTIERAHSKAFWRQVGAVLPGWRRERDALERAVAGGAL